jgi:putative FmdB family regulatory protein
MPIFEYKCENCGKITEKFMVENVKTINCPSCNSISNKIFSVFGTRHSSDSIRSDKKPSTTPTCPTGSCCSNGSCS